MSRHSFQLGLMKKSQCPYLPNEEEQIALVLDTDLHTPQGYSVLIEHGFRRSGEHIYRPYCESCTACHSLRISAQQFKPSKSQKRQIKQLEKMTVIFKKDLDKDWFALYQRYIHKRHRNGSMYPANQEEFISFTHSKWQTLAFMHIYEDEKLIAVAVTDIVQSALSALYTFFEPEHHLSLGSICILAQIQKAKEHGFSWLYLGFQIDQCAAMNYKNKFKPHEQFIQGKWIPNE